MKCKYIHNIFIYNIFNYTMCNLSIYKAVCVPYITIHISVHLNILEMEFSDLF